MCHLLDLFPLTMKSGGSEHCTLKWLRLCWIQVSWLTGICSNGVLAVHVWIGGNISPHHALAECTEATQCGPIYKHRRSMTVGAVFTLQTADLRLLDQVKKTPPARWKHPRGWAVCGMIQITAPVSLDSVIWHNIHNGNQESSHSTFRTILISFFITWAHLYPWDLILIFFPVSDVIQNPKIHCFIYLCQWRNLFSINCRNGNQMIRTSSQSFSHINCPIFKVIVLNCHPSHSPPVWQNCNCGRKLCRKR